MKYVSAFFLVLGFCALNSCHPAAGKLTLAGTWRLVSATSTQKDSTVSTFNSKLTMIKILNETHFAFLSHAAGKDTVGAPFSAGGGTYTLADSVYTESLEYYIDPQWENNRFPFTVHIVNDTLIQQGIERRSVRKITASMVCMTR